MVPTHYDLPVEPVNFREGIPFRNAISIQKDLVKAGDDLNDAICPPRAWPRDNICDVAFLNYSYNIRIENQLVEVVLALTS